MSHALDTNVVLYHLSGRLLHPLPAGPLYVSVATEIELLAYKPLTSQERTQITAFLSGVTVVDLDRTIAADAIRMRLTGLRIPDAVVAATALACSAELLTHDARLLKTPGLVASSPTLR